MAHNSSMNSQQQHSMMNSVTGVNQRGLVSKAMYQPQPSNMSQLSHIQPQQQQQQHQQSQLMGGYSSQKPSELTSHQFSSNNMLSMNGNSYQQIGGSSLHSGLNLDNNQMNVNQHQQNSSQQFDQHQQHHQSLVSQQQQQQPFQSNSLNHFQQHQQQAQSQKSQHLMQSHQYSLYQGGQTPVSQHSQIKSMHNQHQQQPSVSQQQQPPPHEQNSPPQRQPYVHVQQRNFPPHQPKYDKAQQPRRILQNNNPLNHRPKGLSSSNQYPVPLPVKTELAPTAVAIPDSDASDDGSEEDSDNNTNESKEEDNDELENAENSESTSENKELANTKEKSPMSLVQELAKFNKIERKYTLLDEQGLAHKKTFFVKLQLGTEEYSSSGPSIRKAQQSAAAIALKETEYKHPEKRVWKSKKNSESRKLAPTVELNGLAMKRGENARYLAIEPQQPMYYYHPGMDPRAVYNQRYYYYMRGNRGDPRYGRGYWPMRYHYPRMSRAFYVSLHVGHREFIGDGPTRQAARNNAALKALKVLRSLPEKEEEEEEEDAAAADEADGLKSKITSVHEIAFRRKLTVNFEVTRESGPPHMKTFVTRCTVGDIVTDGEGNSKRLSKKIAAEEMFEKLKDLEPLPRRTEKPKPLTVLKKNKNRSKEEIQKQKADPNYGVGVNAISRLIQIMCAQKKKEPVYTLVAERCVSYSRKEFVMQIEVEGKSCTGSGPNKKFAKRAAAEAMLELLGYNKPSPQPTKSSIKQPSVEGQAHTNGEKKVTFSESCQKNQSSETRTPGTGIQQKVPGLLHLPSKTMVLTPASTGSTITNPPTSSLNAKESLVNLSSILKPNWRPELQLRELCKALSYPVDINDFTKRQPNSNSIEYVSRISIGPADNPQNFLGTSTSMDSARDMACMEALKILMSRVKDNMHPGGDGSHHMKKSVLSRAASGMGDNNLSH